VGLIYLSVVSLLFLCMAHFHGNGRVGLEIWEHLNVLDKSMISPSGTISGGIASISLSLTNLIGMSLHVFLSGTAWFWFVPAVGLMLYSFALVALNAGSENGNTAYRYFACYLVLAACTAPMLFLGRDWGRWFASANSSFLILWLSIPPANLAFLDWGSADSYPGPLSLNRMFGKVLNNSCKAYVEFVRGHKRVVFAAMLLFALTFRLPEGIITPSDDQLILHLNTQEMGHIFYGK
jgi:hypothetical protein